MTSTVPDNANAHCPGTADENAGKASACAGCPNQEACATAPKGVDPDIAAIAERMSLIKHKILVLSGKGGVGKSTFAAQLAFNLAEAGKEVGLLDIDICGPSVPKMMGLEGEEIHQSGSGWSPVYVLPNLAVMSIGFLLTDPNDAVVWRGPRKSGLIKQFLKDVDWGSLDYLIVDAPPGTSDEHISIVQYLAGSKVDGAVVVTTPQEVSLIDVRKELSFCKKVGLRCLGVVENMSGLSVPLSAVSFSRAGPSGEAQDVTAEALALLAQLARAPMRCQQCVLTNASGLLTGASLQTQRRAWAYVSLHREHRIFCSNSGGGEKVAAAFGVPFLGRVPMDPALTEAAERGVSASSAARAAGSARSIAAVARRLVAAVEAEREAEAAADADAAPPPAAAAV